MRYLLVVLTHGRHSASLRRALRSFAEMASPPPAAAYLHADGPAFDPWAIVRGHPGYPWTLDSSRPSVGFCGACAVGWEAALEIGAREELDLVFWLEHDFELLRPVKLGQLAAVLEADPKVAQMALMRDAVSAEEKAAGGLFESRPGQYERRGSPFTAPQLEEIGTGKVVAEAAGPSEWLEHRSYFTTNVNLMRRSFMAENPWPTEITSECEGRFGLQLVERGYSFGVWGDGNPWTRHTGVRTGFGY